MKPIVGIDLGTTTSEIAVFEKNKIRVLKDTQSAKNSEIIASIVAFDNKSRTIKVGNEALGLIEGDFIAEIKREMGNQNHIISLGDQELNPSDVSSLILKKIVEIGEQNLNQKIKEVVITVPANFPIEAKKATEIAAEQAGLKVLRIIQEPTAAALAYSFYEDINEKIVLIYDLGGGTFDVSIGEYMEGTLDVLGHNGEQKLGGKDFDQKLIEHAQKYLLDTYNFNIANDKKALVRLKDDAKRVKEELSYKDYSSFSLPYIGLNDGEIINLDLEITRAAFEKLISNDIDRSIELTKSALKNAKVEKEKIDKIILVGGSTRIPIVREKLFEFFGKEPETTIEPDLAVAMGAAIQASIIMGESDKIILDRVAYGFGVQVVQLSGERLVSDAYSEIIEPNSPMNKEFKDEFSTLSEDQHTIELKCFQREPSNNTKTVSDLPHIGEAFIIDNIPTVEGMIQKVVVGMTYNLNGLIDVSVEIPSIHEVREFQLQTAVGKSNEAEGAKRKEEIERMWRKSKYADKAKSLINAVEKRLDKMGAEDKAEAEKLLLELKQVLISNDEAAIDELEEQITDILINY